MQATNYEIVAWWQGPMACPCAKRVCSNGLIRFKGHFVCVYFQRDASLSSATFDGQHCSYEAQAGGSLDFAFNRLDILLLAQLRFTVHVSPHDYH